MAKPMRRFHMKRSLFKKHQLWYVAGFLIINLAACIIIGNHAYRQIQADMNAHALQSQEEVQSVMDDYRHSFQLFTTMLEREVEAEPKPAVIWKYLKKLDKQLQAIEGDTFDGLYMYYRNSYGIRPLSNMKKADMMPQHVRGTAMQWMRRVKSCSLRRI